MPDIGEMLAVGLEIVSAEQIALSHSLGREHFGGHRESSRLLQRGSRAVASQLEEVDQVGLLGARKSQ